MPTKAAAIVLASLVLSFVSTGCGGDDSGKFTATTLPVKGKVTFRGKPLTRGTIRFEPEQSGTEASGEIQSDGTYEMSSFKAGDGAVPGVHKVGVMMTNVNIPLPYRNPISSPLTIEVVEGKAEYNIDLK